MKYIPANKVSGKALWKGFSFIKLLKTTLFIIMIIGFFASAISVYKETGDFELAFKEVGDKAFNPLYNLGEHAKTIQEEGMMPSDEGFFKSIWEWIVNLYLLLEPLLSIYFVFWLIRFFIVGPMLRGTNSPFVIFFFSLLGYLTVTEIYILAFTDLSMLTPFTSFWSFIKAVWGFF